MNHTFLFLCFRRVKGELPEHEPRSHPVVTTCVASPNTFYGPGQYRLLLLRFDPQRISLSDLHRKQECEPMGPQSRFLPCSSPKSRVHLKEYFRLPDLL